MNQKKKIKGLKMQKKIAIPSLLKVKPKAGALLELKELQTVADAFQPLNEEETFAYYLVHSDEDKSSDATDANVADGQETGLAIDTYIERLLTTERILYVYCGQRDIAGRIQSGRYLIEAIKAFASETSIFGSRVPSRTVKLYYDRTIALLEAEGKKHTIDKEQVFTVLYNLLLVAQNSIASKDVNSEIVFSCTNIELPKIFSAVESRVSPKTPFQKKCEPAIQHIRENPQEKKDEHRKAIEQFFAFGYFKMASEFVVERVKRLGML